MSRSATNKLTNEKEEVPTVLSIPTGCPACGSTSRTKMHNTSRIDSSGEINGMPYTAVVWRRTSCKACGQNYTVKSYENAREPEAEEPKPAEG